MPMIVAIDGPAGAGKSTVARALARRLGYRYVDTGAMYRAVTWLALERGVPLDDEDALAELAEEGRVTFDGERVVIAGRDVSGLIRDVAIDRAVSAVARHPAVRAVLRRRQRAIAGEGNAVLEGRDIGTVVCPDADVKVFLVADPAERARRRGAERPDVPPEDTATDLELRDLLDSRQLAMAPDAHELDTTSLTPDEVVAAIEQLVAARAS